MTNYEYMKFTENPYLCHTTQNMEQIRHLFISLLTFLLFLIEMKQKEVSSYGGQEESHVSISVEKKTL